MAFIDKSKDPEVIKSLNNFMELDSVLFGGGDIPSYEFLFEKASTGEPFTVKEAYIMRLYSTGIPITPEMEENPKTKARARAMVKAFGKATGQPFTVSGFLGQVEDVVKRGVPLETDYADFYKESTKNKKVFSGINKSINALHASIEKFKKGALAPKGSTGSKKFKKVPTQDTIRAINEGIARIPDKELRDAVYISVFGMRGAQLADVAVNYDVAVATENVRPYFDPETGVLESPEAHYNTRKPLPPSKTMGPISTSILERRYADTVEIGGTRLFPNVSSKNISDALAKYVFSKEFFPQKEVNHLGKRPSGITDLRKIFVSYTIKELGYASLADQLLGHPDNATSNVLEEAVSKVGKDFYITEDPNDPKVYGALLRRLEQNMAQASGYSSFTAYAEGMRIEVPIDQTMEFVDDNVPEKTADTSTKTGDVNEDEPTLRERTEDEIEAARERRLATDIKGTEEARLAGEMAGLEADKIALERAKTKAETTELKDQQPTRKQRNQAKSLKELENNTEVGDAFGSVMNEMFSNIMDSPAGKGVKKAIGALGLPGMGFVDTENRLRVLEEAGYGGPQAEQYVTQDIGMKEGPLGVVELVGQGLRGGAEMLGLAEPKSQEEIDAQQVQAYENQLLQMGINPEDIKAR